MIITKPIIILGSGPSHYLIKKDKCKEVWCSQSTYNKLTKFQNRVTRVFRLHPHELDDSKETGARFVSFKFIPINKLRSSFGDMFHSSAAWMIATAVAAQYNFISLYGIDAVNREERGIQRDGLFRLIGICESHGVQFKNDPPCGVFLAPQLYGLQDFIEVQHEKNIKESNK